MAGKESVVLISLHVEVTYKLEMKNHADYKMKIILQLLGLVESLLKLFKMVKRGEN